MLDSGPDRLTNPSRQSDARRQLDNSYKERERVHRKISVHRKMELRQAEQQLQRVDEQRKTSEEKVKQLTLQLEQEAQRRTLITNDYKSVSQEVAKLRLSEKQYKKEQTELKELLKSQDEKVEKIKHNLALNELQMKELQDQFEAEQYFSTLYKKQVRELKEEVDERANQMQDVQDTVNKLQNARDSLMAQLELTLTKADSEQLARAIAQGQYDDLEKEKTMLEMEMEQMRLTHKSEMNEKNSIITMLEERNHHLSDTMDNLVGEKNELNKKLKVAMEYNNFLKNETETIELIKKDHEKILQQEKTLKIQAINKLAEVMNRKDLSGKKNKISQSEFIKIEKQNKKIQQELKQERAKYSEMALKYQWELSELQNAYQEEYQKKMQLQMELDSKDSEIEQISFKLQALNSDTASINSGMDLDSEEGITDSSRVEGWLAIPNRQNIKRYGWKKQYVVVSSRKIVFYNDEGVKQASNPEMVLDIDKLYHVRSVTQGDVKHADAKDIPRIFQLLYAGEGESKIERDNAHDLPPILDKEMIQFKNHEFLTVHFHVPTGCESCRIPLGGIIKPPTALECRRCHMKVHKDHYDKKEEVIPPCKVNFDVNTAKNLLLLASCSEDQQQWVHRLSKKIINKAMTPSAGSPST